jgi:hypothetical protein
VQIYQFTTHGHADARPSKHVMFRPPGDTEECFQLTGAQTHRSPKSAQPLY